MHYLEQARTLVNGARDASSCDPFGRAVVREGLVFCGRAGGRGSLRLSAGVVRRRPLGRRRPHHPGRTTFRAWALSHLVRRGRYASVLSRAAQRLLARTQAMGRRHTRLSPGKHLAARRGDRPGGADPPPAGRARSFSGSGHLRAASGPRGIGGLDRRAEEHALRRVLFRRHALPTCTSTGRGSRPCMPVRWCLSC